MREIFLLLLFLLEVFNYLKAQEVFQKTYSGNDFEYGYVIRLTSDGGSIVAGVSRSNFTGNGGNVCYLVKLDSAGNIMWTKSYGTTGTDVVNDLYCTTDGGYLFGGYSYQTTGSPLNDNYVIKVNAIGDTAWTRVFNFRCNGGSCRFNDGHTK